MSDELKPCPLCGCPVLIHRRTDGQVDGIVCDECLLTLEAVDVYPEWHTLDELVLRWNARAAVTDEQFAMAVHDGEAWQVVRTCENVLDHSPCAFECSECGFSVRTVPDGPADWQTPFWRHCPNCGTKVVG